MPYNAPVWNLASITEEMLAITGRDTSMLSAQQSANFINYYYQYVLPKELKIFWGYTSYKFFAKANIDQYVAPEGFQTLNPSAYADGWPIVWYIDPDTFYQDYPQQENKQTVDQGDGSTNSFNFNISAFPVLARSVYVTDGFQIVQDTPLPGGQTGTFVDSVTGGAVSGSINYITGVVVGLSFLAAPAANTNITVASQTYMANRPQSILFYKQDPLTDSTQAVLNAVNMFVLRPVPDQVYQITLRGMQIPKPLVNDTDVPFRPDLGPLIALGASIQIFKRFNQMDQIQEILPEYTRFKDICMADTMEEYLYERSIPKF